MFKMLVTLGLIGLGACLLADEDEKPVEPAREIPEIFNPFVLQTNALFFAAAAVTESGEKIVYTDMNYEASPDYVKKFIYWHEMGHFNAGHRSTKRSLAEEFEADAYAASIVGKSEAIRALRFIFNYLCKVCPAALGDLPSRIKELGGFIGDITVWDTTGNILTEAELRKQILEVEKEIA